MITKLLVANRAEIASRVFRTCRSLGISTVAIHSDADAGLPYVREADQAVRLPGNTPAETYLNVEAVLAAARATGADAIHPGYGFLSENAEFASIVEQHGIAFIGPSPDHIRMMGDKIEAKRTMARLGVPLVPGSDGPVGSIEEAEARISQTSRAEARLSYSESAPAVPPTAVSTPS